MHPRNGTASPALPVPEMTLLPLLVILVDVRVKP
jgi:hypothetical protein